MIERLRRARNEKGGFTLIELLVVVIIIGILAAIAIPAFLGQQDKAEDAEAKSLVRNAATAVEAAYVDTRSYLAAAIPVADLNAIEPTITFNASPTAGSAVNDSVMFNGSAADGYSLSTVSGTGTTYTYTKAAGVTTRTCGTGCTW